MCSPWRGWKRLLDMYKIQTVPSRCYFESTYDAPDDLVAARQKDMPDSNMENPYKRDKTLCVLCKYNITPNYKNVKLLSQFISPYTGRVYGRHITRLCSNQQAKVEAEIKKARDAGMMAYYLKEVEFLKDPKLFNPEQPVRPHRF
ncbi:28S ribosomal protein S18c, mitochondrial [Schistocerca piceifrons]|uniref:28S ribosomal protein S18c, mitochondrial n=1 Tax=Schistocerca piceifrons TaxID=274613 RepID=UPI001F5F8AFB|nr:28S ribosomal protein S18c, mitochondrial [Schistocerca piceifrons]XP_049956259.1 28S ribosomal protein S18c, mitochondrial [Schistocerca serialis cubense]